MTWSAPIWIYLWLAGMAGGAYLAGFLASRFSGSGQKPLLATATIVGIPLAVVGVIFLVADLGTPILFWHLMTQFKVLSPMSMGTWLLLAWVAIAVVLVVLWWLDSRVNPEATSALKSVEKFLGGINLLLAIGLIAYTGVLLAVSSQSMWAGTVLLPALFVASAISTGVAMLVIAALALNWATKEGSDWKVGNGTIARLAEADAIIIIIELVVLVGFVIWLLISGASGALGVLFTGSLAAPTWIGVVLLALLIPLALDMRARGKAIEGGVLRTVLVSSLSVIIGGLILRWVITIGGQM